MSSPMARGDMAILPTGRDTVLVVDDDRHTRALLEDVLEAAGYEVRSADDGRGALAILGSWRPAVVLLDPRMPGPDGSELSRHLAASDDLRHVAVVAMSARAGLDVPLSGVEAHARVEKPIDVADLLATLWVVTNP
jgi:CheY-like chemotaxis protein